MMLERDSFYDLTRTQCVVFRGMPTGPAVPLNLRQKRSRWHSQAWRREMDAICRWSLAGGLAIAAVWQALRAWL